jgi:hypothetical protein
MAKMICVCLEMHQFHISIAHQGPDNVGGVAVDSERMDLPDYMELAADYLCQFFVALADLNLEDTVSPFSREMLGTVLYGWTESDKRHNKD